ncbi:hypothetical protein BVC71_04105 [Marivivens niveibacter]|uniref:Peptidase S1 n=1 Tax=Marivivens niveibacter TaxID=1930667 RepID=A0A251X1W3_9RHOB|nr:hypothetical protein [Marivivens niveibacter]OUD10677.1 hypothetical protein BVC71_04105 [Marivivens niveibacter]
MKYLISAAFGLFALGTAAQACPDYSQWGDSYSLTGSQMRKGVYLNVVAGGENYIGNCRNVTPQTDIGAGYFTTAPDFTLEISGMSGLALEVAVVSDCDSALLINTASGTWYYDDDDNGNYDPRIVLTRPADGYLDVWIGTYDGDYCDAQLQLETFRR